MSTYAKSLSTPRLDVGRCLDDAIEVYKRNLVPLFVAAMLWEVLSGATMLVLAGPLTGGMAVLTLRAMRRPDRKVQLRELFSGFERFWSLTGLFLLSSLAILMAFGMLLVPGVVLMTLWMYPVLFLMDRNQGVFDSIRASQETVLRRGFWPHLGLLAVVMALVVAPMTVPFGGVLLGWVLSPLAWLIVAAAYQQSAVDKPAPLEDMELYG